MHPVFFIRAARYVVLPPGALAISTAEPVVSIEGQIEDIVKLMHVVTHISSRPPVALTPYKGENCLRLAGCNAPKDTPG